MHQSQELRNTDIIHAHCIYVSGSRIKSSHASGINASQIHAWRMLHGYMHHGHICVGKHGLCARRAWRTKSSPRLLVIDISIMRVHLTLTMSFDRMCSTHIAGSIPPTQFPGLRKTFWHPHLKTPITQYNSQCLLEEDRFWCCTSGSRQDTGSVGTAISQILPVGLLLPLLPGTPPPSGANYTRIKAHLTHICHLYMMHAFFGVAVVRIWGAVLNFQNFGPFWKYSPILKNVDLFSKLSPSERGKYMVAILSLPISFLCIRKMCFQISAGVRITGSHLLQDSIVCIWE